MEHILSVSNVLTGDTRGTTSKGDYHNPFVRTIVYRRIDFVCFINHLWNTVWSILLNLNVSRECYDFRINQLIFPIDRLIMNHKVGEDWVWGREWETSSSKEVVILTRGEWQSLGFHVCKDTVLSWRQRNRCVSVHCLTKMCEGRLRGRQVQGTSCCCKRVNNDEKQ